MNDAFRLRAEIARRRHVAGESLTAIAVSFDLTENGLYSSAAKFGGVRPKIKGAKQKRIAVAKIFCMESDDYSTNHLAEHLGIGTCAASGYLRALDELDSEFKRRHVAWGIRIRARAVLKRRDTMYKQRLERIIALRDAGLTLEEIGTVVGLTRERVRQICDNEIVSAAALRAASTDPEPEEVQP